MTYARPDPDALLARVQADTQRQSQGHLKIFFGSSPGVGKTYAMLAEAHERRAAGADVVAGVVETHGRRETEAMLDGLEVLPRHDLAYRGVTLAELDIDAALARRPSLILVDELAHTNAPGSRHAKRWQDVEELLDAGIDVYTTVNVQHVESLNDVVAQITGVQVRETVPDVVIERADSIELIDTPPDEVLQRMREGKVYIPQQAERAAQSFFRKGNLIALRELALRRTAERVDAQMQDYREDKAIAEPWPARERLLVCISPAPEAMRLVRAGRRMASRMRAAWLVLYVELPAHARLPQARRDHVLQAIRLAEQLGAETATRSAARAGDEIAAYARQRNVSRIIVGRPRRPRWKDALFGSVVDDLLRQVSGIDVQVITDEAEDTPPIAEVPLHPTSSASAYGWSVLVVAVCTVLASFTHPFFESANLVMIYLMGVLLASTKLGRGPSVLASLLSVAAFDFFFVRPFFTFAVSDVQYIWTFGAMLAVSLVFSTLTVQLRQRADSAAARERRTAALYALSRALVSQRSMEQLLRSTVVHVSETFECQAVLLLPVGGGRLQPWGQLSGWWGEGITTRMIFAPDASELGVAQWAFDHGEMAGHGTNTLPLASALYVPLRASRGAVGVLGVRAGDMRSLLVADQRRLLEVFSNQIGLAIERFSFADEARQAQVQVETERIRASLLSTVSHDLRTPLATITGASSSLIEGGPALPEDVRADLAQAILAESARLSRLVSNLLDMTRIESRAITVAKEWQPLEEVVGAALTRLDAQLAARPLDVAIPDDTPLVPIDGVLIEQVLVNLLENALKHTPEGTPIAIGVAPQAGAVRVAVADRGPGIPTGEEARVFEKFYRASGASLHGSGLGLAICKGIIDAHGGQIWAEQRPGGGAVFSFTIPLDGQPPALPAE
ncbi:sensor histidine kinase KdpD [Chloroflexia bacterium SDU3-3]|nr:sensor histidine kinase KdpD [Chloroflexia bacterium SDU3-3]